MCGRCTREVYGWDGADELGIPENAFRLCEYGYGLYVVPALITEGMKWAIDQIDVRARSSKLRWMESRARAQA